MITLTESERLRARVVGAPGGDRGECLRLAMHALLDEHLVEGPDGFCEPTRDERAARLTHLGRAIDASRGAL